MTRKFCYHVSPLRQHVKSVIAKMATVTAAVTVILEKRRVNMAENESSEINEAAALVPMRAKPVDFYGEELIIAMSHEASYVALRPICDYLGMDWSAQYRRIQRDTVLLRHTRQIKMAGGDGKQYSMVCLQLEYLPGWLFGVTTGKLLPQLVEKLEHYREECFQVLWRAYQAEIKPTEGATPAAAAMTDTATLSLIGIRDMGLAIAAMAEQQLALQEETGGINARLDRAAVVVNDLQRRVSVVETRVTPAEAISDEQAAEIATEVKALAELLTTRGDGRNHYQNRAEDPCLQARG
jgi:hypothetical protein